MRDKQRGDCRGGSPLCFGLNLAGIRWYGGGQIRNRLRIVSRVVMMMGAEQFGSYRSCSLVATVKDKRIRTAWNEEEQEWYFSVVDVVS